MEYVSTEAISLKKMFGDNLGDAQCVVVVTIRKDNKEKQRQMTRKDLYVTNTSISELTSITDYPLLLFTTEEIQSFSSTITGLAFALNNGYTLTFSKAVNPYCYNTLRLNSSMTGFENAKYIKQDDLYILDLGRSFVKNEDKLRLFNREPFDVLLDSAVDLRCQTLCYSKKNGQYQVGLWDAVNNQQTTAMLRLSAIST